MAGTGLADRARRFSREANEVAAEASTIDRRDVVAGDRPDRRQALLSEVGHLSFSGGDLLGAQEAGRHDQRLRTPKGQRGTLLEILLRGAQRVAGGVDEVWGVSELRQRPERASVARRQAEGGGNGEQKLAWQHGGILGQSVASSFWIRRPSSAASLSDRSTFWASSCKRAMSAFCSGVRAGGAGRAPM